MAFGFQEFSPRGKAWAIPNGTNVVLREDTVTSANNCIHLNMFRIDLLSFLWKAENQRDPPYACSFPRAGSGCIQEPRFPLCLPLNGRNATAWSHHLPLPKMCICRKLESEVELGIEPRPSDRDYRHVRLYLHCCSNSWLLEGNWFCIRVLSLTPFMEL